MRSYRAMFVTGGALALWGLLAVSIAAAGGRDDHKDRDDHRDKDKEMSRAAVKRLVERSLPQWNRRVLNVPDGKRWVEEVDFSRILGALGEEPPPQDLPLGARQFRDELRTVRLDPGKGAIRYLSRERAWVFQRDFQKPAFDAQGTLRRVMETVRVLGAPLEEASEPRIDTQMGAGAPAGSRRITDTFEMYRLVHLTRRVGRLPVFGSVIQAAVSHEGQVQRLQVSWPSFSLVPQLRLRSRRLVVDDAVQRILDQQPGLGTRVNASLVYAPQEDEKKVLRYVPSVLLAVGSPPTPYLVMIPIAATDDDDES